MSINLKVPAVNNLKPKIMVIGVGGAGGNAVNNMITANLTGVEFVAANTDAQALAITEAEQQIQMGISTTEGLGAGACPDVGRQAAEEASEEIRALIANTHLVFIAAGMGGGTGTGAAPVIAKIAREEGALTIGVVTKPFHFEGKPRMRIAEQGIVELKEHVDTLIVIPNQNLFRIANERTTFLESFKLADQVLHAGIACITDLILKEGRINLDLADIRRVMEDKGSAVMGTGQATGDDRALLAAQEAISNPLLDEVSLRGAQGLLISISGGSDLTLYDVEEAASRVRKEVDPEAITIVGAAIDETLEGHIRVSIVASGVGEERPPRLEDRLLELDPQMNEAGQSQITSQPTMPLEAEMAPNHPNEMTPNDPQPIPVENGPAPEQPIMEQAEVENWQEPADVHIEKRLPSLAAAPIDSHQKTVSSPHDASEYAPQPPVNAPRMPRRMPNMDDFTPHAQQAYANESANRSQNNVQKQQKKLNIFERLAGVGRTKKKSDSAKFSGRQPSRQENLARQHEIQNEMQVRRGRAVHNPSANTPDATAGIPVRKSLNKAAGSDLTDGPENLEIPPFLRRS